MFAGRYFRTANYRARCPLLQGTKSYLQIFQLIALYFVVVPPVTVNDFADRSEEFFGKKLKRPSMYDRLKKHTDIFCVKDGNVYLVENEEG